MSWGPSPRVAKSHESQAQSHESVRTPWRLWPMARRGGNKKHRSLPPERVPPCTSNEQLTELEALACMQVNRSGRHSPGREREKRSQTESRLGDQRSVGSACNALHMQHVPSTFARTRVPLLCREPIILGSFSTLCAAVAMRLRYGLPHRHAEHVQPPRVQVVAVLLGEVTLQGSPVGPEL